MLSRAGIVASVAWLLTLGCTSPASAQPIANGASGQPRAVNGARHAAGSGIEVFVAYADSYHSSGAFPSPWNGSPNVDFEGITGCSGGCIYDGGTAMVVNDTSSPVTLDYVTVTAGACTFDMWPHGTTLPVGQSFIVDQTKSGNGVGCTPGTDSGPDQMDTSDIGPNGQNWDRTQCGANSGIIPVVTVSVNGVVTSYEDSRQIMNTGGVDQFRCRTSSGPAGNESHRWVQIGGLPSAPLGAAQGPNDCNGGGSPSETVECNLAPAGPVNLADGNLSLSHVDFDIPAGGIPLELTRTYNSDNRSTSGPFGYGWSSNVLMSLSQNVITGAVTIDEEGGSQIQYAYDVSSGLYIPPAQVSATLIQDAAGWTLTRSNGESYEFDSSGKLSEITDPDGYTETLTYSGSLLSTVSDFAGRHLSFTWSGGHISRVVDPLGRAFTYTYGGAGDLATVTDPRGNVTTYSYDGLHRLTAFDNPRGVVTQYSYDLSSRVSQQTVDPTGLDRVTMFSYTGDNSSASGGSTLMTAPAGNQVNATYAYGELQTLTNGYGSAGAAITSYTYDPSSRRPMTVTDPNGGATTNVFDSDGNVIQSTDAIGGVSTYEYNRLNEVIQILDPMGRRTKYAYSKTGNLTSVTDPLGDYTSYDYSDSMNPGAVTSVRDANGETWRYVYDSDGNRVTSSDPLHHTTRYVYDGDGELTSKRTPMGRTTRYTYDAGGNVLSVRDPLGHVTTYVFDANGNRTQETFADGSRRTFVYDGTDELTQTAWRNSLNAVLKSETKTYDSDGRLIAVRDGLNHATTYGYDSLNRLVSSTDPLSRTTTYTYDGDGNRLTLTDAMSPMHRVTTYAYDALNRVTDVSYSDGHTHAVHYTYDKDSYRTSMSDGTGLTQYRYDLDHQLTHVTQGNGSTLSFGYDHFGNVTSIKYPNGEKVYRAYYGPELLHWVKDWLGRFVVFGYNTDSELVSQTAPHVLTHYAYDALGEMKSIVDKRDATRLAKFVYTRDGLGRATMENAAAIAYDPLGRVVADSANSATYAYDASDRLTTETFGTSTTSFSYDAANELLSTTNTSGTTTYGHDALGERTSRVPPVGSSSSYTYDQAGNLTGLTSGSTSASYGYDGDSLRITKTVDAAVTQYVWDISCATPELLQAGNLFFIYGPLGLPLEQIGGADIVDYLFQDANGSTRLVTNLRGRSRATFAFDANGNAIRGHIPGITPLLFRGLLLDGESGLYYTGGRYYDSRVGQYLTPNRSGWASYLYRSDDPLGV